MGAEIKPNFLRLALFSERKGYNAAPIDLTSPVEITLTRKDSPHMVMNVFLVLANQLPEIQGRLLHEPAGIRPFDLIALYKIYLSDNKNPTGFLGYFVKGIGEQMILGKDSPDIHTMTDYNRQMFNYWSSQDVESFLDYEYRFCLNFGEKFPTPSLAASSSPDDMSRIFYRQPIKESFKFNPYSIKQRGVPIPRMQSDLPVQIHVFQKDRHMVVLYAKISQDPSSLYNAWQIFKPGMIFPSQTPGERLLEIQPNTQNQLTLEGENNQDQIPAQLSFQSTRQGGLIVTAINNPGEALTTAEIWIPRQN